MTDGQFLVKFEKRQLDRSEWTHEAHVRMAWLYVTKTESYRDARSKVRTGIKRLNAAFQARSAVPCGATQPAEPVAEARPLGYHETLTTAFVRLIAARARPGESFATFRKRNPELFDRKLSAILKHYSSKLLFSEEAKTTFAQPDLEPLPKPWLAKV
jgi:hypothetical protein